MRSELQIADRVVHGSKQSQCLLAVAAEQQVVCTKLRTKNNTAVIQTWDEASVQHFHSGFHAVGKVFVQNPCLPQEAVLLPFLRN